MREVRRPDISTPIVTLSNYAALGLVVLELVLVVAVGAVVPVVVVGVVVGLNVRVVLVTLEFVVTDGQCFPWVLR